MLHYAFHPQSSDQINWMFHVLAARLHAAWILSSKLRASNRIKENKVGARTPFKTGPGLFICLVTCCWGKNMREYYGKLGPIENRNCCQWHPLKSNMLQYDDDRQGLGFSRCSWDSLIIILSFTNTEFRMFQMFIFWFFTAEFCMFLRMLSKFLKPVQYRLHPIHQFTTILKLIVA